MVGSQRITCLEGGRSLPSSSADKKGARMRSRQRPGRHDGRAAVTADVVPLRADPEVAQAAELASTALTRHLDRCGLAANTIRAYRRQAAAYVAWLAANAADHPDAFADTVGAEAAVTRWRRHLLQRKASPASVNQALAAVTLLYEHGSRLRITVKRARVERPGEPDALTPAQQGTLERAADRRGRRDAAIIAVLLYTGARVEECAGLEVDDVAITARTGQVRLLGKGDQVRTVPLPARGRERVSAWLDDLCQGVLVVVGEEGPGDRLPGVVVVPDGSGQGEDALQHAHDDTRRGVPAVAFQVELALEGVVDRLDDLPQRLEQVRTGPLRLALARRAQ